MIRIAKRLSVNTQFGLLLLFVVSAAAAALVIVSKDIRVAQAYKTGSAYADVAEAIGNWAARTNGLWVKSDPQTTYDVGSSLERDVMPSADGTTKTMEEMGDMATYIQTAYHRKNPALIQREISDVLHTSNTPIKFKMISDNPMNRSNMAHRFEMNALDTVRENLNQGGAALQAGNEESMTRILAWARKTDYYEVQSSRLLYARPIVATKACLKCHETPEKAPASVKVNYPGNFGFGYQEGKVVGVFSVEVPMQDGIKDLFKQMSTMAWFLVALFLAAVIIVLAFMRYGVIKPVTQLTDYADALKRHEDVQMLTLDPQEQTSKNQLHRLSASIKALHKAMSYFQTKAGG